jgi:hypothetical protein
MVNALRVSAESRLAGSDSLRSTACVIVSTKHMSASPRQKVPGPTRAVRGENRVNSSPVLAYQMISTLQAKPVDQCCHRVVGLGERAGDVAVWREEVETKCGGVIVPLRCELSGCQVRLSISGCGDIDVRF